MIFKLCLMLATVIGLGLSSAQAQNSMPNRPARLSPVMLQARQAFLQGDFAAAATYMRIAAGHGDLMAQVALGKLYLEGRGVPQNTAEGFRLLQIVLRRHHEPSYSLAVSALRSIAPTDNGGPDDLASAVRAVQEEGLRRLQRLDPATRDMIVRLGRTPGPAIMMCNASMCF